MWAEVGGLKRGQLEAWLEKALVPVEPSPVFIRQLQARLVTVRGDRAISPWMLVLVVLTSLVLLASWLNVATRIVLGLLSLFGLMERSRLQRARRPAQSRRRRSAAQGGDLLGK
jgi:hypothetical protein